MKLLYMIIATFVQVLLTSFVLYTCASPVPPPIATNEQHLVASESRVQPVHQPKLVAHQQPPAIHVAAPAVVNPQPHRVLQQAPVSKLPAAPQEPINKDHVEVKPVAVPAQLGAKKAVVVGQVEPVVSEIKKEPVVVHESPVVIRESSGQHPKKQEQLKPVQTAQLSQPPQQVLDARSSPVESKQDQVKLNSEKMHNVVIPEVAMSPCDETKSAVAAPVVEPVVKVPVEPVRAPAVPVIQAPVAVVEEKPVAEILQAPASPIKHQVAAKQVPIAAPAPVVAQVAKVPLASVAPAAPVEAPEAPIVKGGQGPLHLLAATLCSYQPDRPTGDEQISNLYGQRASLRKSLFDFMSLKFTNLEKFSSRLHSGLEVMPPKPLESGSDHSASSKALQQPTHGWPVVGKCTAHDLRLMAEAAWCECTDSANCEPVPKGRPSSSQSAVQHQQEHHKVQKRSIEDLPAVDMTLSSSANSPLIVPKLVDSIINNNYNNGQQQQQAAAAALIDQQRALGSLNLTQQQYSAIQVQAGLTQECKRNALRLSKALFQHLAEDQSQQSESWPKLYAQLQEDECARKRLIDIVTALSGYRTEASSIRRDNVEFAFAMDDLRSKVLESEVTAPLTFDRHFIEVEQFLQQSVKLMLANIDPERAKLTSMRYRSLMPAPLSADDQCVQLHQLLLAKTHPQECNPNQYGQLPDILRMAANSLALWSIESELSKLGAARNLADVHPISVSGNSNECIANLVSS